MAMPQARVGDMDEGIRASRASYVFGSCAGDNSNSQTRRGRICQGETRQRRSVRRQVEIWVPRSELVISHMEKARTHRHLPRDGCSELKQGWFTNSIRRR